MKNKLAICAIIKNCGEYLDEWITYHKVNGFEYIHLYEYFESETHEYITNKYDNVFLEKINGIDGIDNDYAYTVNTVNLYNYFIEKYHKKYDWCLFLTIDDFIKIDDSVELDAFLTEYNELPSISLLWHLYGADGKLRKGIGCVMERFTKEIEYNKDRREDNVLCSQIVNMNKDDICGFITYNTCGEMFNTNGEFCETSSSLTYDNISINRYVTKSFEEWCEHIFNNDTVGGYFATFKRFFFINKDMYNKVQDAVGIIEKKEREMYLGNMSNYTIFIHAHKDIPNRLPTDKHYVITATNSSITSSTHNVICIDDDFTRKHSVGYGEACTMHYLWKHKELIPDYVGLNHYRRFFINLYDTLVPMKRIIDEYGAIIPYPYHHSFGDNRVYMSYTHMKKDAELIEKLVKERHPEYIDAYNEMAEDYYQYACNLFAMKKEDFIEMCDFVFDVMEEYDKEMGFECDDDVLTYVKETEGKTWNWKTVDWQKRLEGFWVEWLTETFYRYKWGVDRVFKGKFYLITEDNRKLIDDETLLVSLTTWTERIKNAYESILSLKNSCEGYNAKVVLVLSKDEFNINRLSNGFLKMIDMYDVELIWDDGNIRSHKKLIPTLEKYPNNPILVCDDDKFYPVNLVKIFMESYAEHPNDVIVGGSFFNMIPYNGKIHLVNMGIPNNPHNSDKELYVSKPANGCYGVLYPPHTFNDKRFFDRDLINKLSIYSDEDWQFMFNVIEGRTLRMVKDRYFKPYYSGKNERYAPLHKINSIKRYVDRHNNFLTVFPEYYSKLNDKFNDGKKKQIFVSVHTCNNKNPFVFTLYGDISRKNEVIYYKHKNWNDFFNPLFYSFMDIMHIQWCESFSDIEELDRKFKEVKEHNIKIITTVHNITPHIEDNDMINTYNIVYNNTDVFIHLGNYSKSLLEKKYPNAEHIVIPHHIYDNLLIMEQPNNSELLDFTKDKKKILIFGENRKDEEVEILKYISKFKDYEFIAPNFNVNIENVKDNIGWIAHNEISTYFNECDYVFIDRYDGLNSGNIPMAMLFGKPIIGPSIGNMKEILETTGNYLYDPTNLDTLDLVFEKLSDEDKKLGESNKVYAKENLSVFKIGDIYYDLYKKLKEKRRN